MKALILDLDGTLVDSVYAHVLAWHVAHISAPNGNRLACCLAANRSRFMIWRLPQVERLRSTAERRSDE
jgi:phosphoglycolate phosphatase-like HAD superfamily hydrolase